ncbi:MAG: hypothetical protein ACOCRX_06190 [Candidatus Woesearchaeota archaeon]
MKSKNYNSLEEIVDDVKNDFLNKALSDTIDNLDSSSPSKVLKGFSYLKRDLESVLKNYLDLDKNINYINKDELKQPLYGIISSENINSSDRGSYKTRLHEYQGKYRSLSDKLNEFKGDSPSYLRDVISNSLDDWEKVMFYSGIWRANFDNLKTSDSFEDNLKELVKKGYDNIHKKHMIKYHKGEYKRKIKVPKSQNYRIENDNKINLKLSKDYEDKIYDFCSLTCLDDLDDRILYEKDKFLEKCSNGDYLDKFLYSLYKSGKIDEIDKPSFNMFKGIKDNKIEDDYGLSSY